MPGRDSERGRVDATGGQPSLFEKGQEDGELRVTASHWVAISENSYLPYLLLLVRN